MSETHDRSSEHLNFSQRYGYEPLPRPMQLEEISKHLRREIGNRVRLLNLSLCSEDFYGPFFENSSRRYYERVLGRVITQRYESQIPTSYDRVSKTLKNIFKNGKFYQVLNLLEIMIEELSGRETFATDIKELFVKHSAAY